MPLEVTAFSSRGQSFLFLGIKHLDHGLTHCRFNTFYPNEPYHRFFTVLPGRTETALLTIRVVRYHINGLESSPSGSQEYGHP